MVCCTNYECCRRVLGVYCRVMCVCVQTVNSLSCLALNRQTNRGSLVLSFYNYMGV